jgi:uncharacterized protein YegP (UPF0339 family)
MWSLTQQKPKKEKNTMKFVVQTLADGRWYWWIVSKNGTEVARSKNAFKRKSHCVESARSVIEKLGAKKVKVEVSEAIN